MPTLVVQMGHCYRTAGATGTNGEQAFATAVANACIARLHGRGGWSVRKILADDTSANYRGDAFVAVHCDGSTSTAARGASVGYRTPEGQTLGQAWKRAYAARGWPGFRPDNYTTALAQYYGTGTAVAQGNRRALIVECGFLTNPDDRALLTGPGGADRVALAIGDALGIPHQVQQGDDMSAEAERKIDNIHAQLIGDDAADNEWGATPPDQYPGWLMPDGKRATVVSALQHIFKAVDEVKATVGQLNTKVDQIAAASGADPAALADAVNDEADRRGRDGDPTTGPTT